MWPGSALFLNVHYCQVELEINAVGFHFFRGAFFFFFVRVSWSLRSFKWRWCVLRVSVSQSSAAVRIEIDIHYSRKKKNVNCFAAKTTNHCPAYTQSKALRCCNVVHVSCGQTKMAASSLLLKKKKSKSQCSSYTSDKPGCFSARAALDAMFFLRFFLPFTFRLEACAPPFFPSAVYSCARHEFLSKCRTTVQCHSC